MFVSFCVSKYVCLFLCSFVCLFVCLGATLLLSLYLLSVFTVIVNFDFVIQPLLLSIIYHHFYFIFSSVHWGRIQDDKFERHGLPLSVRCMSKPFKVSINYLVLFILQKVTFCFCLFLKLSLATTTGVDAFLRLSFDII